MTSLRISINDETVYDGPPTAVPRVGDEVLQNDERVRITSVVWDFAANDAVAAHLLTGDRPYTF